MSGHGGPVLGGFDHAISRDLCKDIHNIVYEVVEPLLRADDATLHFVDLIETETCTKPW